MKFRRSKQIDESAYTREMKDVPVATMAGQNYPPARTLIVTAQGSWLWVRETHSKVWDELCEGNEWINVTLDDPRRDLLIAVGQIVSVEDCSERFREGVTARAVEADRISRERAAEAERLARDYAEQEWSEAPQP